MDADPGEVRRIVGIELGALLTTEPDADVTGVSVTCREELTDLAVHDPITAKSLTRSIDASRTPPKGKARLVALAIAELVAASWIELESNPQPRVTAASPPASPEARAAALDTLRERRPARPTKTNVRVLGVVGHRTLFADTGMSSWGLGARAGFEGASGIGATIDLLADHATINSSLGGVSVDSVSSAPALSLQQTWRWLSLEEMVGARIGLARVRGESNAPERVRADTLVSPWGGPLAALGLRARLGSRLVVEVATEAGYALFPVSALIDDRREVSIRNFWLGAQLGIGLVLDPPDSTRQ